MPSERLPSHSDDVVTVPGRAVADSIETIDVEPESSSEGAGGDRTGRVSAPGAVADDEHHASIDHLLALTSGEALDVEEQLATLKQVAATRPLSDVTPPPPRTRSGRPPPLPIPSPFELAPTQFALPVGALPSEPERSPLSAPASSPPPGVAPSRPPPLPSRPRPRPDSGTSVVASARSVVAGQGDLAQPAALALLLTARLGVLEREGDSVGLARTHVELAIAAEVLLSDDARARAHLESALAIDATLASAHGMLRRRREGTVPELLDHVDHELAAATGGHAIVELLAEKARLLEALGATGEATSRRGARESVRATWEQALTHAPQHAAALKGLEAELFSRATERERADVVGRAADDSGESSQQAWEALAVHLARMADAYASSPPLAAWLHVERAQILERRLGRVDAARGALERALELDPSVGPVREACVRHVARHADWSALARLLAEEASIEPLDARAARLELDAASIARVRLGEDAFAIELLERALSRAPTEAATDRRVLDELVSLHEKHAHWADAVRARRARLRFVNEPAALAYELRVLAQRGEAAGDREAAIADVQRALQVDATDPTLVETLDRLLASAGRDEQRVALWVTEAARTDDGAKRARALARAASLSEGPLRRPADAVRHLRAAWVASPGDTEVLDALSRLLAPKVSDPEAVRGLVDLYAQAADHAPDDERRVAYLEKIALLSEELAGDPARAVAAYAAILELAPDRRAALLGLQRTAARVGDARALARALLEEARMTTSGASQLDLRTRAAAALAPVDPPRALVLVQSVLAADPACAPARALETRLHEEAGRWEQAARSILARIDAASSSLERVGLWLALAQIQDTRLHEPLAALSSLQAARSLDPAHPVPPVEIARVLEATGDTRALRAALEGLTTHARTAEERAQLFVRAAELDEMILADDAGAVQLYQRALAECPDDELAAERLDRVLSRRVDPRTGAGLGEQAAHIQRRIERTTSPITAQLLSFDLAMVLSELGTELPRAAALLEGVLSRAPQHVPALRVVESLYRRLGDVPPLCRTLSRQGDVLPDLRARLGALWNLASYEQWRLRDAARLGGASRSADARPDAVPTVRRILELDPSDPGALEATVERELLAARRGDQRARRTVIGAVRSLAALASDDASRIALQLRLALLLEAAGEVAEGARGERHAGSLSDEGASSGDASSEAEGSGPRAPSVPLLEEALGRYRDVLRMDELSVTAATGLLRLSNRLGDEAGAIAAAIAVADISSEPRVRARYLVDAAERLLARTDDESRARAATLLERALAAEPESIPAAGRLATVLAGDGGQRRGREPAQRLVDAFRGALARAQSPEAVVMLGSEIARVARDELKDLTVAIDAMRRVREVSPQHVPSLLTLAELCIAQRSWPEAVSALEAVVATSREAQPRLTALFALASVYEKVLSKPEEVERALRAALDVDPKNPRALRALLRRVATSEPAGAGAAAKQAEIEDLLSRLAEVEKDPEARGELLLELAEVRRDLKDARGVEAALVEAVALRPDNARAFARLAAFHKEDPRTGRPAALGQMNHVGYARSLAAVIGRGQELGAVDARWFAALGQVEVSALGRVRDGIAHLQRAVQLDPNLHETRFELADGFARLKVHDEAVRTLLALVAPSPRPLLSLSDPAAALEMLERELGADRRAEEAIVVSELRALEGSLDAGRLSWLRARRLPPLEAHHGSLDRPTLVTHVLPAEGRHILLEVAAAIAGVEAKILRADLSELGLSSRDRVSARSGHPTRALLDRIVRQLALGDVELVVSTAVARTRVLAQDVPWLVVPRALTELPEPAQLVSIARALARVALGVPWLEELPKPHIEALLVAAARQVVPTYAADDLDVLSAKLVAQHEPAVARALGRRQKKVLEELAPHLSTPLGRPPPIEAFVTALARAELRTAYLLGGDLMAAVDEVRAMDVSLHRATESHGQAALSAVLEHPFTGDLFRFALSSDATALRRRVGSTWAG